MAGRRCWLRPSTCGSVARTPNSAFSPPPTAGSTAPGPLPNQVGWPIAKELLFTARVVEAEEAHRIGLLNHLVPRDQLRAKTMELAKTIAGNNRAAVIGVKALLLKQMTQDLEAQWDEERRFARAEF